METQPGATVTFGMPAGDGVVASANGQLVRASPAKDKTHLSFTLPPEATELVALYEDEGNASSPSQVGNPEGLQSVQGASGTDSLAFSTGDLDGEGARGAAFSSSQGDSDALSWQSLDMDQAAQPAPDALLTWYRLKFECPSPNPKVWVPWHLHVEAQGNGFIYMNGHCLGRYWQIGPQHDFYLPESWLFFGPGQTNIVALNLRPLDKGVSLQAISVAPDTAFAEKR
jgi:hypothetical protein